jgi:hypothetical protein
MKRLSILHSFQFVALSLLSAAISLIVAPSTKAATLKTIDLTALPGFININNINGFGSAVYRANLADIGDNYDITSIIITDIVGLSGGSPGKFTGFDLDAIKLSYQKIDKAEDILDSNIVWLDVFDFTPASTILTPGTILTAGTQRDTNNPAFVGALFGTNGQDIDNNVATLDKFDAVAIADQRANGFVSLGDDGKVVFQLKNSVLTTVPLYLYIAEVGGNGEKAKGEIIAVVQKVNIPEPTSLAALSLMGVYFTTSIKKKKKPI